MFRIDPHQVGWRFVDGCALVFARTNGRLYRLNHAGTEMWKAVAAASAGVELEAESAPVAAASPGREGVAAFLAALHLAGLVEESPVHPAIDWGTAATTRTPGQGRGPAPQLRRIIDIAEVVTEIRPDSGVSVRRMGDAVLVRSPDSSLSLLSGPAAAIWNRLTQGPCAFVDLLDVLCTQFELSDAEADDVLMPLLRALEGQRSIRGVAQLAKFSVDGPPSARQAVETPSVRGMRPLGRMEFMEERDGPRQRPKFGIGPIIRDGAHPPQHVAIVCQYGIVGLAPGIESYVQRCIRRLNKLNPDLIVLSGGGRHGLADVREAESIVERYRDHFPHTALWVEKYSSTSWENLQHSLEMLLARPIVPRRIFLIGDRARTEKLRLSVWLARRRFPAFRDVSFRVVPVARERVTWRDWRVAQVVAGLVQVLNESRAARPPVSADIA